MRVCIDTNVVVQLFGRNAAGRPIRDALLAGRIELAVSNDILLEYEEAITLLSGQARWQQVERFLSDCCCSGPVGHVSSKALPRLLYGAYTAMIQLLHGSVPAIARLLQSSVQALTRLYPGGPQARRLQAESEA